MRRREAGRIDRGRGGGSEQPEHLLIQASLLFSAPRIPSCALCCHGSVAWSRSRALTMTMAAYRAECSAVLAGLSPSRQSPAAIFHFFWRSSSSAGAMEFQRRCSARPAVRPACGPRSPWPSRGCAVARGAMRRQQCAVAARDAVKSQPAALTGVALGIAAVGHVPG